MSTYSSDRRVEGAAADKLLSALSIGYNRSVLAHLSQSGDDVASLPELAAAVAERRDDAGQTDPEPIALYLHHAGLPKLAEAGVVDYDRRGNTVRYRGHPLLDGSPEVLQGIGDSGKPPRR